MSKRKAAAEKTEGPWLAEGMPKCVGTDNGHYLTKESIDRLLVAPGISVISARPHRPDMKASIEMYMRRLR